MGAPVPRHNGSPPRQRAGGRGPPCGRPTPGGAARHRGGHTAEPHSQQPAGKRRGGHAWEGGTRGPPEPPRGARTRVAAAPGSLPYFSSRRFPLAAHSPGKHTTSCSTELVIFKKKIHQHGCSSLRMSKAAHRKGGEGAKTIHARRERRGKRGREGGEERGKTKKKKRKN